MSSDEHEHQRGHAAQTSTESSTQKAPSHAERCRTLAARARSGALSTLAREPSGFPYGSLVSVAIDDKGRPLLLLSQLAEHTKNLDTCENSAILLTEPLHAHVEPLALGRLTLIGACRPVPADEVLDVRSAFLATHPEASHYVDFADFRFFRLDPITLRYVGGFGRMSFVAVADYVSAEPDPLRDTASDILAHMNDDHADAVLAYAHAFAGIRAATSATMTSVDRYGFDLAIATPDGPQAARVAFDAPVTTTQEVRKAMVALVMRARAVDVP